jgi:hypothetical protein
LIYACIPVPNFDMSVLDVIVTLPIGLSS